MMVPPGRLSDLATGLLITRGVPEAAARLQADLLVEAELRGLPSHGVQRLPLLISRLDKGLADGTKQGKVIWRRAGFLEMDGERGLGPVVIMNAIEAIASRLEDTGIGLAAIRNANHIGMLAYYAEAVARTGRIAIILSTSEALVHPYGGTDAMLGTNPIAIGIPSGDEPFILDLATSIVSMGKINNHALRDLPIPSEWAVDAEGNRTSDPVAARQGAIAPFGEAKGYGLGLAIELIVSLLAGSDLAPEIHGTLDDTHPANKGDLVIMIDPQAGAGSAPALSHYLESVRQSRPSDPGRPVAVPGDGGRARRKAALSTGIDVPEPLFDQLLALEAA